MFLFDHLVNCEKKNHNDQEAQCWYKNNSIVLYALLID